MRAWAARSSARPRSSRPAKTAPPAHYYRSEGRGLCANGKPARDEGTSFGDRIAHYTRRADGKHHRSFLGCGVVAQPEPDGYARAASVRTKSFCWSMAAKCDSTGWHYRLHGPAGRPLLSRRAQWTPEMQTVRGRYVLWHSTIDGAEGTSRLLVVDARTRRHFVSQPLDDLHIDRRRGLLLYTLSEMHYRALNLPPAKKRAWYARYRRCFDLASMTEHVVVRPAR